MELEISKNVLMDIAATTLERIEGLEIALAPMKAAEVLKSGGSLGSNGPRRPRALRVSRDGGLVSVEVGLNVEYGRNLVTVAAQVQQAITENLELMTGLRVRAVNVTVQGIMLPKGA
ncbi:Asp23/Gls24 family envelope stress response protein [Deinococcus sonorensis]|uniref:Asp23/Gls24 family envelope stress response protein n=2 Tax=Deinococcus sonorensis TaxID=309891 RepID=A0AAU7U9K7_9DEIO